MFNFILKCLIHKQIWVRQSDLQVSCFMSRNKSKFYMKKYFIVHLEILVFQIVTANMGNIWQSVNTLQLCCDFVD